MQNEYSASVLQAQFRALQVAVTQSEPQLEGAPTSQALTTLMRHGGLYTLLDRDIMTARMVPLLSRSGMTSDAITAFISSIGNTVASFFIHLVTTSSYVLDSDLISHLSFPGPRPNPAQTPGLTFTQDIPNQPGGLESPTIPAAFTFVGQFIDHDLTMNGVNLFDPQSGPVQNTASPLIDLDSVYGSRTLLDNQPPHGSIFNSDGTFRLKKQSDGKGGHFYDLERDPKTHKAYISDARNDENQMILQIHLLIMKIHNKLITTEFRHITDVKERMMAAYQETLFNWQSMILDEHLPHVLLEDVLTELRAQIAKPKFGNFKYKPALDLASGKYIVSLPHEFAIAFRYGHSQLKPRYLLRSDQETPVPLFNNTLIPDEHTGNVADLRGSQPLIADHVIEWSFFASPAFLGNRIDGKVTSVVFDLPESAIPDNDKFVGNLIQRNLIRSSQVGVCSGEELAAFYEIPALTPEQVDPDPSARPLYLTKDSNGNILMKDGHDVFQTPLWYYILKEAEIQGVAKGSLGTLGSRLIGEVILGAIAWQDVSVLKDGHINTTWKSRIPLADPSKVTMTDLAKFVLDY